MTVVVDASVALDWVLEAERSDFGERVLDHVSEHGGVVPPIWSAEVANGLLVALRRGRLSDADLPPSLALFEGLDLSVQEPGSTEELRRLVLAGQSSGLTAYDAAYLELALRESLPLATHDGDLRDAARAAGAKLFGSE